MTSVPTDLSGRTAVVTGGAGPLGAVLADALATAGARVVVVDLHPDTCAATADGLPGEGHVAVAANLLEPQGLSSVVAAVGELGACDVLVNNAAFTGTSGVPGYAVPFEEQTDESFAMALALNLTAPFSLTRRLAPLLRAGGHGSVVNVSSIYGLVGPNMGLYEGTRMGNPAAYAASKGGLAQLTRYLSTVLAPEVRVNAFAPGGIARGQDDAFVERYERLTPLARMGTEDDFRGVVTWLASDASAYVTGQVVAVDGGWTAW
ncbi:SDR family oxidoreductase [Humibacillus xanthopallidus]|uniref:NAD(P)-dependent dehydrogenase (Short-subunit alcohol dehydrogenase family) n=1 Tax=Humibacillus xanthopallidus TaxID=412689 RepID=A0A543HZZ1_9MICO|nr:SDR family oxidoreductase [Humibacillus xanthopallidus]TQM63916.1 NAD(P)-dependent dehydrogenase (short-subunit alcohol dehydrogenase family) [Humibacillus xanthopallidus]